ncbi:MAG TPA: hypothetical protein VM533_14620, partial [Fimbriiglobus sp.]|nr:hypothetical protein [Fimbriiglobus sp.]
PLPTPKEPPKPATWPEWFGAVDFALVVMAVVIGFLVASFPARNTDLWLQLANGRNLAEGKYSPGADPFTFSGADRAWADTSWLNDLVQYALYSANPTGAAVVAVKAVVFAAAFGLLFLLRRSGQALWPWAMLVILGALAAAPAAQVRPLVWSMLFLAATLLILYRLPWRPGSWRQPLTLAGLFAIWANVDGWFFLGPLTVALVLVGEKLHPLLTREKDPQQDDPFPPAPPTGLLVRALLLGVVACLLNPMVLAALAKDPGSTLNQLIPIEFGVGLPAGTSADAELSILTVRPLFSEGYFVYRPGTPDEQFKVPSVAFAAFALMTIVALAAGFARLRATHILLWVAYAALALTHVRLIPFFALVAAPLAAAHLNGLSSRIKLGPLSDTPTRLALTGSALGRLLSVAAALILLGAAYPGWLHNPTTEAAYANRLEWKVTPDDGLVRAAGKLSDLYAELPESVRGLNMSSEFGNYCAWYAPGERVFVNGRYAFHRPELYDLLAVRESLVGRRPAGDAPDTGDAWRVCDARNAGFLTYTSRARLDGFAIGALLQEQDRWTLWHLDGRAAVFARPAAVGQEVANRHRYNPIRLAFGARQEPLPEGRALQPLREIADPWDALWGEYLARPEPLPPEVDDVEVLVGYNGYLAEQSARRWEAKARVATTSGAAGVAGVASGVGWVQSNPQPVEDDQLALPIVISRMARRAVAATPDRPDVYRSLWLAYGQPYPPTSDQPLGAVQMPEQQLQVITALARFLARIPPPEKCPPRLARDAYQAARRLTVLYRQTGQLDLSREVFGLMVQLVEKMPPEMLRELIPPGIKSEDPVKTFLSGLRDEEDSLARLVQRHTQYVEQQRTPLAKFLSAANDWPPDRPAGRLPGKAIEVFKSASGPNEFGTGDAQLQVVLQLIVMELRAGRLEDAADDLAALDDEIKRLTTTQPDHPVTSAFRALVGVKSRLEGNFAAAAEALPRSPGTLDPKFSDTVLHLPVEFARLANPQLSNHLGPLIGGAVGLHASSYFVRQVLMDEATYQYERAMLALSDGNIPEAERRLKQAARPQGLDLGRVGDVNRLSQINRYLELIRRADTPAGR